MQQNYEPKSHTIVTRELLLELANEQQPARRRRRRILNLNDIQEIRLEYLNILQIDCIWPLTNLVKLKLNNNAIEKIENLDSLRHLCELDLSFNHIKVIENLEALDKIHILSFYDNEIEVVQGIDHMHNLAILSIGKNKIADTDHILYLRKLKQLRSLQISGNPCTTEVSGYTSRLFAFVPQLVYYGYKMIGEKERMEAVEEHNRILSELEEAELKQQAELEAAKQAQDKVAQQAMSYVEHLDNDSFFHLMFSNDKDGKQLAQLDQETEAAYEQYRQRFSEISQHLFELGLKEESQRRAEIKALDDAVDQVLTTATNKARAMLNSVQGKRQEVSIRVTQALREAALQAAEDADLHDDSVDEIDRLARQLTWEFTGYLQTVWANLLRDETIVHEQIEDMSRMFEANMNDMVSTFLEAAQENFAQLRGLETDYAENLPRLIASHLVNMDDEDKTPFIAEITEDKDALNNCLASSHFMHLQMIDDRQDKMATRLKEWKTKFLNNLAHDETVRNRNRILEITHFLNYHKENATVAKLLGQQSDLETVDRESMEAELKSNDGRTEYTEGE